MAITSVREKFLDFFSRNDHKVASSAPLIPHDDPSLLFVNAGMVQFKDCFLSKKKPECKNITTSQKCLRVGGKHNDLDNVGYTKRHHTFFEMLGNFSFGGYFKETAIKLAWEFLINEVRLNPAKLYITVYHSDVEAFDIWSRLTGFNEKKILKISTNDNFWQMAETGPCGPCSEIFYDHGEHLAGSIPADNADTGERFVEIWNLVFMQFYKDERGNLNDLPVPCIDTGMGIERISAITEGTDDNYETQIFQKLIQKSKQITGNSENDVAHRIIADHIRSISFLIADGITPCNTGRGYVLRRIIRRAARYVNMLGYTKPLLYQLFDTLEESMSKAYPELSQAKNLITSTVKAEEQSFYLTLNNGLEILMNEVKAMQACTTLSGEIAFKLYDTYGFPLDLTIDILREKNILVDENGFREEMRKQKERAKKAWVGSGETLQNNNLHKIYERHGSTNFLGYEESKTITAKVLALLDDRYNLIKNITTHNRINVVLDKTAFYGESGGQEGDRGVICNDTVRLNVLDTKKTSNGLCIHICEIISGDKIDIHDEIICHIDEDRRSALRRSHSATHLLHHVLRKLLGNNIAQKGSLVAQDRLRFDFSYQKQFTDEQLHQIEMHVNLLIWNNEKAITSIMSIKDAIQSGAIALFGEKYDKNVRVVNIGDSKELCGGTHVNYSCEIGFFKITSEGSIASGVRRIEAVTNANALQYIHNKRNDHLHKIEALSNKIKNDEKSKQEELFKLYEKIAKNAEFTTKALNGNLLTIKNLSDIPNEHLRRIAIEQRKKSQNSLFVYCNQLKNQIYCMIAITDDIVDRITATGIIQKCKTISSAKGGGNDHLGQLICNKEELEKCMGVIESALM